MNNTQQADTQQHKLFVGSPQECERHWYDYCTSGRRDRLTVLVANGLDECWLWADSDNRRQPR